MHRSTKRSASFSHCSKRPSTGRAYLLSTPTITCYWAHLYATSVTRHPGCPWRSWADTFDPCAKYTEQQHVLPNCRWYKWWWQYGWAYLWTEEDLRDDISYLRQFRTSSDKFVGALEEFISTFPEMQCVLLLKLEAVNFGIIKEKHIGDYKIKVHIGKTLQDLYRCSQNFVQHQSAVST